LSGAENVTPSAIPRGMIETLRTGSAPGVSMPTIAWPPSWYAVRRRSSGLISTWRSAPSTMRSRASVKSDSSTCSWLRRAASSAASFARLARSAPTMPGGVDAIRPRSTPGAVGRLHRDPAVEAARAQQRLVEHVRAVGRPDHDHVGGGVEPVHLRQDLVQRLLALVVAAAEAGRAGGARAADGVELVDKDDRRRGFLRLGEEVANARGADPDDRLDELGGGLREERHLSLARDRPGQQRLAGSGRAREQHAVRDPATELAVLLGVAQEVDDLCQLRLRLVDSRDVREGDPVARELVAAGARAAE